MYDACKTAKYGQLQGINCVRSCGHGSCASARKSLRSCASVLRPGPDSNVYLFNQARRRSQCLASSASTMPCLSSASFICSAFQSEGSLRTMVLRLRVVSGCSGMRAETWVSSFPSRVLLFLREHVWCGHTSWSCEESFALQSLRVRHRLVIIALARGASSKQIISRTFVWFSKLFSLQLVRGAASGS